MLIYRVASNGPAEKLATFERAGVNELIRLIARGFGLSVSDVLPNRRAKQQALLKHETDLLPNRFDPETANVLTVNSDFAG